jgi:hypothetical protein
VSSVSAEGEEPSAAVPARAEQVTVPAESRETHLRDEDRPEYERILDEAVRSAGSSPAVSAPDRRFSFEQLRTMALNATALITAAAATEYRHYVRVREEARQPAPSTGEELTRAREAWRTALLERGIRPFLREALALADPVESARPDPIRPGYGRPGSTSPNSGPTPGGPRPGSTRREAITSHEVTVRIGDVSYGTFAIGSHAHAESHHSVDARRDAAAEELLRAVRELRADLTRVRADEQTEELAAVLAATEDEITHTGTISARNRERLRQILMDSGALVGLLASAGAVAGLLGM